MSISWQSEPMLPYMKLLSVLDELSALHRGRSKSASETEAQQGHDRHMLKRRAFFWDQVWLICDWSADFDRQPLSAAVHLRSGFLSLREYTNVSNEISFSEPTSHSDYTNCQARCMKSWKVAWWSGRPGRFEDSVNPIRGWPTDRTNRRAHLIAFCTQQLPKSS